MTRTDTGEQWVLDGYAGYCRFCGRRRTFPFERLNDAKEEPCDNLDCPSNLGKKETVRVGLDARTFAFVKLPEDLDDG